MPAKLGSECLHYGPWASELQIWHAWVESDRASEEFKELLKSKTHPSNCPGNVCTTLPKRDWNQDNIPWHVMLENTSNCDFFSFIYHWEYWDAIVLDMCLFRFILQWCTLIRLGRESLLSSPVLVIIIRGWTNRLHWQRLIMMAPYREIGSFHRDKAMVSCNNGLLLPHAENRQSWREVLRFNVNGTGYLAINPITLWHVVILPSFFMCKRAVALDKLTSPLQPTREAVSNLFLSILTMRL